MNPAKKIGGHRAKAADRQDQSAQCAGIDEKELDEMRYQAVALAAKAGDVDAQVCFVQSDFNLRKTHRLSDQEIERYQIDAISYANSGLERGDWRVVALMTRSTQALSHVQGFLGLVTDGDAMTIYRMTRLLRLGASGDYAARLDDTLDEYIQARSKGLEGYDPEQLAQQDAWTQQEYDRYFVGSPCLAEDPQICGD